MVVSIDDRPLIGALYAYPVCLALGLLFSQLWLFRRIEKAAGSSAKRPGDRLIWHLQAVLCFTLLVSSVVALLGAAKAIPYNIDPSVLQAQVASYLGVFLFFGAGLLPDPDGPFSPEPSNLHMWVLAILFEASILGVTGTQSYDADHGVDRLETGEAAIAVVRILLLLSMSFVFLKQKSNDRKSILGRGDETDALLGNGNGPPPYDAVTQAKVQRKDAQSAGWLDYFVGFKTLFPYIWPSDSPKQQVLTIICFMLMVLQRAINILVPYQLGVLVDHLGRGHIPYKDIALYCLYRGFQGQQGVLGSIRAILWIPISQSLYRRLSSAAFEHVLLLSLDFHLSKRVGEVMAALSKGSALNTFLDGFGFQLFPMVFDLGIAAVFLFINFDAFYSIIVIAVMWSYVFATVYMAKYRGRARREMTNRSREMDASKTDAIMAYETVHHNSAVPNEVTRYNQHVDAFQKAEFIVQLSLNALNALQNLIFIFGVVLVSVLSAYQISIGLHKVSDFVTLITYFAQLHSPLSFFGTFVTMVQNNLIDAERMLSLFKQLPEVVDDPHAAPLKECTGRIEFKNVSFSYDERRPALDNVSFTVAPGTKTAIVGESGGGKSTILKILFRFYDTKGGSYEIDGKDSRSITVESLRNHIGVVPQDTVLFNESIMYNLLYASPGATKDEVFAACQAASIHHRILQFPEGYDTRVGERGLKLSGGEKQRVAIARAILKQPQIMLLDEATASLDSHTERQIQDALENVTRGRTTITIAHRLSTITHSDHILVLHGGRVVERGQHNELLALGGRYSTMWNKQTTVEEKAKQELNNAGDS